MDLHEAWFSIKRDLESQEVQLNLWNMNETKQAIKLIDNFLDPYIKRICTMKGE
jgi:hypothetical protein